MDGALHKNEHGDAKKQEIALKRPLQADEQQRIWQDDGEPTQTCGRKACTPHGGGYSCQLSSPNRAILVITSLAKI